MSALLMPFQKIASGLQFSLYYLLFRITLFISNRMFDSIEFRYVGNNNVVNGMQHSRHNNYLMCLWHQNIYASMYSQRDNPFPHVLMASKSRSATPLAKAIQSLGFRIVRGSSKTKRGRDKGGAEAMHEMTELLRHGWSTAIAVDGPTGPAKETSSLWRSAQVPLSFPALPAQISNGLPIVGINFVSLSPFPKSLSIMEKPSRSILMYRWIIIKRYLKNA